MAGKKGKVMERRLLKDFHIGIVEGLVNEIMTTSREHKDVFTHIAKVISKRASNKRKKDWNEMVRKSTIKGNPIGSAQEAEALRQQRQSLRRHILHNVKETVNIDHDKLIEYNPKLSEVPRGARVAYAKFMTKKIKEDYGKHGDQISVADSESSVNVNAEVTKTAHVKFKGIST